MVSFSRRSLKQAEVVSGLIEEIREHVRATLDEYKDRALHLRVLSPGYPPKERDKYAWVLQKVLQETLDGVWRREGRGKGADAGELHVLIRKDVPGDLKRAAEWIISVKGAEEQVYVVAVQGWKNTRRHWVHLGPEGYIEWETTPWRSQADAYLSIVDAALRELEKLREEKKKRRKKKTPR